MKAEMKIAGIPQMLNSLGVLGKRIAGQAKRKAVKAGADIVLAAARVLVPQRRDLHGGKQGLLRKSLGIKTKVYPSGNVAAIVGPRRGMRRQIGTLTRGPHKGQAVYEDPANIGHLVEGGTRAHALGMGSTLGRAAQGKRAALARVQTGRIHPGARKQPFVRPAVEANGSRIQAAVAQVIRGALP